MPIVFGGVIVLIGGEPDSLRPEDVIMDSHARYLCGILFAIGLGFWSCIPAIETKSVRFKLLAALVVIGGLSRLAGVFVKGMPSNWLAFFLVMELVATPLLCLWQAQLAKQYST